MSRNHPTRPVVPATLDGVVTRRRLLVGGAALGAAAIVRPGDAAPTIDDPAVLRPLDTRARTLIAPPEDDRNSREAKLARRAKRAAFDDRSVDALVEALAMAGVATYAAAGAPDPLYPVAEPRSPVALLRSQVATMTAQLSAGSGARSADLDAAYPVPEDVPPPSLLLAAYVSTTDTVGARIARELMRPQELDLDRPGDLVVPTAVQALFASDLLAGGAGGGGEAGAPSARPLRFASSALATPCSDIQGFIDGVIEQAAAAIKVDGGESEVGQFAAGFWNALVDLFAGAVKTLAKVLTEPVLKIIRAISALIGVGAMIASLTQPWTVALTATPGANHFRVEGGAAVTGEVVAAVDSPLDDWPTEITDCVAVAGGALPPLRPTSGTVSFSYEGQSPIPLIDAESTPSTFADGKATFGYATRSESKRAHEKGTELIGSATVTATFTRDDLGPMIKSLASTLFNGLLGSGPASILAPIAELLGAELSKVAEGLLGVSKVTSQPVTVPITYHVEEVTPTPADTDSSDEDDDETGCVVGTWRLAAFVGPLYEASDTTYEVAGEPYLFTFAADGTIGLSADGAAIEYSSATDYGVVSGTITITGTSDGTWDGDPDGAITLSFGAGGFSYANESYLDGTYLGGDTFTAEEIAEQPGGIGQLGNGQGSATCGGDAMDVVNETGSGIRLERVS